MPLSSNPNFKHLTLEESYKQQRTVSNPEQENGTQAVAEGT